MTDFHSFNLNPILLKNLEQMNFKQPTEIQLKTIPAALEGNDILGSAQTGTGKTAAFGIPLINKILTDPTSHALVITPTRELATQVLSQLQLMLGSNRKIKTALLIGGDSMTKQLGHLRSNPKIVVGTAGRINDHLKRRSLNLKNFNYLVLDETDRMLDMDFSVQIDEIINFLPAEKQTILFSATLPRNIIKLADDYLNNPLRISVEGKQIISENIDHQVIKINYKEKYEKLSTELTNREGSVIVFVKTQAMADKLSEKLFNDGFKTRSLHGGLKQRQRDKVIKDFRRGLFNILVATDVAARGLDIPHIEHVINYDLPQCATDYVHRIGRTARAGSKGAAICFVTTDDYHKWEEIEDILYPEKKKARKQSRSNNSSSNSSNNRDGKKRFNPNNKNTNNKNNFNYSRKKTNNFKKKPQTA